MDKKYLILSDIHGNVSAMNAVLEDCDDEVFSGVMILGDCIDYGMRSNEIIEMLQKLSDNAWKNKVLVNIWGNHEKLVIEKDFEKLSSDRGRIIARYTEKQLTWNSVDYIKRNMERSGKEFLVDGIRAMAVHGSMEDFYWTSIVPENLHGEYIAYDLVLSGHSHYPHCFIKFYPTENIELRNKKAVIFINPGSVGQPRNQNPFAQYAVLSLPSKSVELRAVRYDIAYEQSLYPEEIDPFYKTRLIQGV